MTRFPPGRSGKVAMLAVAAAFLCMGLLAGSTAHAEKPSLIAGDDEAVVVFVRPAGTSKKTRKLDDYAFVLADSNAKVRALLFGGKHSLLRLEPGKHNLYMLISVDPARQIRVDLAAGRTYFVLVEVTKYKRKLVCIHRASPSFEGFADAIRTTEWDGVESLNIALDAALKKKDADRVEDKIRKADERWEEFAREEQEWRNLQPEDGRTAEEMRALKLE